jgi:peptidylprolyl isomerase domain and WD repeat-containing protein 1
MIYNPIFDCVVSVDNDSMMEYWQPRGTYGLPDGVKWEMKSETDLFEFAKCKSSPVSMSFSPDFMHFATMSLDDRQVRVFSFVTGKLLRKFDESFEKLQDPTSPSDHGIDSMDLGRRIALDRELSNNETQSYTTNVIFDSSGYFLLYGTPLGVKVVNWQTKEIAQLIGHGETIRFVNLALYQGIPNKKKASTSLVS